MITYLDGTVFNAPVKTYVNTVNCAGIMGAGIALEFKLRYPEMFNDYVNKCQLKQMKVGVPRIFEYSEDIWIMNFPTKGHWRYPSKMIWIEEGLKYFVENYKKRNIESIAFPKLGTSNGGLEWEEVKALMDKYLGNLDIDVYICLDEKNEAEGTEKEMLDRLNNFNINNLVNDMKVSKKQAEIIISNLPYTRLWHLSKTTSIGVKTYEKVFEYLYKGTNEYLNLIKKEKSGNEYIEIEQMKLF
ncbi:macro domain-containing protein [Clostridium perfringens]|nr:macro domain-containing protein [Clostridium perfringens]MDM0479890.1 macro domain-containing protein [Clostridium perfringens]MDM0482709.1 macro domain-containing protein [Clostridium perfringens]MDM0485059.1 macro domain-containing protein [Clostridium perfringens]